MSTGSLLVTSITTWLMLELRLDEWLSSPAPAAA